MSEYSADQRVDWVLARALEFEDEARTRQMVLEQQRNVQESLVKSISMSRDRLSARVAELEAKLAPAENIIRDLIAKLAEVGTCNTVLLNGAEERTRIALDFKNQWMARAVAAEAKLAEAEKWLVAERKTLLDSEQFIGKLAVIVGRTCGVVESRFDLAAKITAALTPQAEPQPPPDREQAISFAYGNVSIHNPAVTREMVAAEYDKLHPAPATQTIPAFLLPSMEGVADRIADAEAPEKCPKCGGRGKIPAGGRTFETDSAAENAWARRDVACPACLGGKKS